MLINIKKFANRFIREKDGATVIEFAFVVMPFLLIVFGIIEAGRIGLTLNGVQYAIEETSRYAAINNGISNQALQTYAEEKLQGMFVNTSDFIITSSHSTSGGVEFVQIDASYKHSTITGGFLGDFGKLDFTTFSKQPIH